MNIDISKVADIDIPIDIPELNETADELLSSLYSSSNTTTTATDTATSNTTPVELPNISILNPIPINVIGSSSSATSNIMLNVSPVTNPTTSILNMNTPTSTMPPTTTNINRNVINTSAVTAINTNSLNATATAINTNPLNGNATAMNTNPLNAPATAMNTNPLNASATASNILGPVTSEGLMNYNMYPYNAGYSTTTSTVTATTPLPNYPQSNTMTPLVNPTTHTNTMTTMVNPTTNTNTTNAATIMNSNYMNQMSNYSMYPTVNYQNYNVAPAVPDYVNFKALPHIKYEKIQKPKKVYYKKPKIYNTKKRGRQ